MHALSILLSHSTAAFNARCPLLAPLMSCFVVLGPGSLNHKQTNGTETQTRMNIRWRPESNQPSRISNEVLRKFLREMSSSRNSMKERNKERKIRKKVDHRVMGSGPERRSPFFFYFLLSLPFLFFFFFFLPYKSAHCLCRAKIRTIIDSKEGKKHVPPFLKTYEAVVIHVDLVEEAG